MIQPFKPIHVLMATKDSPESRKIRLQIFAPMLVAIGFSLFTNVYASISSRSITTVIVILAICFAALILAALLLKFFREKLRKTFIDTWVVPFITADVYSAATAGVLVYGKSAFHQEATYGVFFVLVALMIAWYARLRN